MQKKLFFFHTFALVTAMAITQAVTGDYDLILLETVGVGQSEVAVMEIADLVLVLNVPGLGDDVQAIKAGILEIGDLFAVNKADRPGADRTANELRAMLELGEDEKRPLQCSWSRPLRARV